MVTDLEEVVLDLERHAAQEGWDAEPRLFALVETAALRGTEPEFAEKLGLPAEVDTIAALEQPPLPGQDSLEVALASIAWPETVSGCAVIVERIVLPPGAEDDLPSGDPDEEAAYVADHPDRQDVRVVVGVLRDGSRHSALRLRDHDDDAEVLSGPDLVPMLADALAATFDPDVPPEAPGVHAAP